jgi:hypothetical protein
MTMSTAPNLQLTEREVDVLRPIALGHTDAKIAGYSRRWVALLVEPVELISFVMSRRMLRGIKDRAQRAAVATLRTP